jgi:hypothetical protein
MLVSKIIENAIQVGVPLFASQYVWRYLNLSGIPPTNASKEVKQELTLTTVAPIISLVALGMCVLVPYLIQGKLNIGDCISVLVMVFLGCLGWSFANNYSKETVSSNKWAVATFSGLGTASGFLLASLVNALINSKLSSAIFVPALIMAVRGFFMGASHHLMNEQNDGENYTKYIDSVVVALVTSLVYVASGVPFYML